MNAEAILGVWKGTAKNSNGWEMEITVFIPKPFVPGDTLGTYTIPAIPCDGSFRVMLVTGERLDLRAEDQAGECGPAESDSLTVQPDGTLLYVSKGDGWEARGTLERVQPG
jgi:hypothetical protein